jgi:hypothetical protein
MGAIDVTYLGGDDVIASITFCVSDNLDELETTNNHSTAVCSFQITGVNNT